MRVELINVVLLTLNSHDNHHQIGQFIIVSVEYIWPAILLMLAKDGISVLFF